MKTQRAQLNYLLIAPRKVRLIANTLKGMTVAEARAQLLLRPQRSAQPLLKLLNSAVSNAKNNHQLDATSLKVAQIWVDPAPVLKRSLPRAQGRATSIFKRMSHVTIELAELEKASKDRFVIAAPEKKEKGKKETLPAGRQAKKAPTRAASTAEQKTDLEHSRPEKKVVDSKESIKDVQQAKQANKGFVKRLFNRKSV